MTSIRSNIPCFMFDPSNPNVGGRIVGITMIAQKRKPLANIERFYGAGVYALYYNGDFPGLRANFAAGTPDLRGKADPADAASKTAMEQGDRLARAAYGSLEKYREGGKPRCDWQDFEYRALVVQTGWQTSAEDYLIHLFKTASGIPAGVSATDSANMATIPARAPTCASPWDTLHPGRDWAHRDPKMKDARPAERIIE